MDEIKSGDESPVVPGSDASYEACPEKIMKILSDDQRQKFEKLRGTPLLCAKGKPKFTPEAVPLFRFVNIGEYKGKTIRLESSPDSEDGKQIVVSARRYQIDGP